MPPVTLDVTEPEALRFKSYDLLLLFQSVSRGEEPKFVSSGYALCF
jgi:hypothetical protein